MVIKTRLAYAWLFFIFSGLQGNVVHNDNVLQGQKLFEQARWNEALECFEKVNADNDSGLLFNKGTCHYLLGDVSLALALWLQSIHVGSFSHFINLRQNMLKACDSLQDEHAIKSWKSHMTVWRYGLMNIPWIVIQICFLLLWFMLVFFIYFDYRWHLWTPAVFIFLLICFLMYNKYKQEQSMYGVVKKETPIMIMPNHDVHAVGQATEGTLVSVKRQKDNWCFIITDAISGWMHNDAIHLVDYSE